MRGRVPGVGALIAAAGSGTRLGRGPKAFVTVRGRTLLDLCLEGLAGAVEEVVVALPAGTAWEPAAGSGAFGRVAVVAGGRDRQESVTRLASASTAAVLLVHDVARPFVTPLDVARVAGAAAQHGAATAAVAVADTLVEEATGGTVDRSRLRAVQTPQAFARDLLLAAHRAAAADGVTATDDAALVRRLGHEVRLVAGSWLLGKLTDAEDLEWAEAAYDAWRARLASLGGAA